MHYSQPYGAYGDPRKHIKTIEIQPTNAGARVQIEAAPGLGGAFYQIWVDNVFGAAVWCPEGEVSQWVNVVINGSDSASIVAFRIGAQPQYDNSFFAALQEESPSKVTAAWDWTYEVLGTVNNADLTGWTIAGLTRAQTSAGSSNTRGIVSVDMDVTGGTAIVSVGTLASGTGAVGTTLTLTELNGSGVTGTVDVDAGAVTGSGTLSIRWPKSMQILRDQTSPPTTVITTAPNTGGETGSYTDPETLDAGTYYYAFRAISDTDDVGDQASPQTVIITGAPGPVGNLAYVSGDAGATVVSWTASDTVGATYNIYIANPDDDFLDTTTPAATATAGSTGATLPAITGFAGIAQVLVRAEFSGTEELNGDILFLEYDSGGVKVNPRPNIPSITAVSVSSGLQIDVAGNYDPSLEDGAGDSLQLFTRTPSGSYDFGTPDDTASLGSAVNGFKNASLSDTQAVGWYYVTLKAITSIGTQSTGNAPEVLVYVSDVNAVAPTGTFTASRG